jgi:hypothetical protein
MDFLNNPAMQQIFIVAVVFIILLAAGSIATLYLAAQSIRDLEIPPDADFFETMQAIPITIPIALDLLDLALDVFSAPISWFLLDTMGLGALKMVTVVESIIPGTQVIPTMTLVWLAARFLVKDRQTPMRDRLRQEQYANRERLPAGRGRGGAEGGSRADYYRSLALPPGQRAGRAGDEVVSDGRSLRSRRGSSRAMGGLSPRSSDDDLIEGEIIDEGDYNPRALPRGRRNDVDDYAASEDFEDEEY